METLGWVFSFFGSLLVLSLVGAMWSAVRPGTKAALVAALLLLVPGVSALGALWAFGAWPAAARSALEADERVGEVPYPDKVLFGASGVLYAGTSTAAVLFSMRPTGLLTVAVGGLGLLFVLVWLAASQQAYAVVELFQQDPGDEPMWAATPGEWAREREAVEAALLGPIGAERAWAEDVLARHAARGEPEAVRWAQALAEPEPPVATAGDGTTTSSPGERAPTASHEPASEA
jgi:hypothetical protein